jgi:hypothetical protein
MRFFLPFVVAAAGAGVLPAQQQQSPAVELRELRAVPGEIADSVQRVFNDPAARRLSGDFTVRQGETIPGNLALLNGQLVVAGRVTGRVAVINGGVTIRGGRIDGTVTVVGGIITTVQGGTTGDARSYPERVAIDLTDSLLVVRDETDDERWYRRRMTPREGSRGDLRLVTARTYNRVEGLPLLLGPRAYMNFSWGRITADAMGVLRSADRFELQPENLGHLLRMELQLGGARGIRLAGRLEDVVAPVEDWHLSDSEVGLASFLLHRDYRDYFTRHGGSLSASAFYGRHLDATVTWADEKWLTPAARDPWSLLRDNQDWRPNPVLDEGRFHLVRLAARYDTRNDRSDPWTGWFVTGEYEYGVGRINAYGPTSLAIRDINPTGRTVYDRVMLDVRRYNRLSAEGQLNLRLVTGGWLSGDDLPLQRRFALGSAGTLPGYDFRQVRPGTDFLSCAGSRPAGTPGGPRAPEGVPAQCERFMLIQAEYRGEIGAKLFGILDEERRRRRFGWGRRAEWVVFADLGRGWLVGPRAGDLQYGPGSIPGLATFRGDVGLGLRLDDLGLYVAKSVTDARTPINFFARLQPRF